MSTPLVRLLRPIALALLALAEGCYHATVDTGAAPAEQVVERCCEAAFLGGLVGPRAVQSDAACPDGVARVETRRSFSNLLFTALTVGLYSPMSMRITCAARPAPPASADVVPAPGTLAPAPDYDPPHFVLPSSASARAERGVPENP